MLKTFRLRVKNGNDNVDSLLNDGTTSKTRNNDEIRESQSNR